MTTRLVQLYHSWQFFEVSVPILHLIATQVFIPRTDRAHPSRTSFFQNLARICKRCIFFPYSGGYRTFVFQFLSWTLFLVSLLLAIPPRTIVLSSSSLMSPPSHTPPHLELLMAIATFSAIISLLFMIKSVLLFDPSPPSSTRPVSHNHHPDDTPLKAPQFTSSKSTILDKFSHARHRIHHSVSNIEWDVSRMPSKKAASSIIIMLGMLWSALGAALLFAASIGEGGNVLSSAYAFFSAICFTIAAFTTHGLGGHLLFSTTTAATTITPAAAAADVKSNALHRDDTPCTCIGDAPSSVKSIKSTDELLSQGTDELHRDHLLKESCDAVDTPRSTASSVLSRLPSTSSSFSDTSNTESTALLSSSALWKFYQPFKGGTFFVATQATGWCLFASALSLVLWGAVEATLGVMHRLNAYALAAGTSGIAAELILAGSLLTYNVRGLTLERLASKGHAVHEMLNHATVIGMLYVPVHIVVTVVILSFLLFPPLHATALWTGSLAVYFSITGVPFTGIPGAEHTGQRQWPAFQRWLGHWTEKCLPLWLGSFEVKLEDGAVFDPERRKYVFAYAPHGLYPLGAAYLPHTPSFRRLIPDLVPVTLTASVVFQLPVLRDFLLWAGARVVNKSTFLRALREKKAVLVVPGGQAELVEAYRMPYTNNSKDQITHRVSENERHRGECVLYTQHRGFVRLALAEKASLVPVVVFGEVTSLRNFINAPELQRWTYKKFGFPVPFLIVGKGGILPFPSASGLKFVIGKPINPPSSHDNVPTDDQVDAMHKIFYDAVEKLWEDHKKSFPGYERIPLRRI